MKPPNQPQKHTFAHNHTVTFWSFFFLFFVLAKTQKCFFSKTKDLTKKASAAMPSQQPWETIVTRWEEKQNVTKETAIKELTSGRSSLTRKKHSGRHERRPWWRRGWRGGGGLRTEGQFQRKWTECCWKNTGRTLSTRKWVGRRKSAAAK